MSVKLFVFDWDGTALGGHDPYDRFPGEFARFLDGLAKRGIDWATNTTWGVETQFKVITASGVKSKPAFLTGSTGRAIAHLIKNKFKTDALYAQRLRSLDRRFLRRSGPDMRRIASRLIQDGLADQLYFNPYGHNYISFHFADKLKARKGWRFVSPLLKTGNMYRMSGADNMSDTILPAHMNKGAVIEYMQKRLGLRAEETMVAGDGYNDRHMFDVRVARWMICPSNADPWIKALVRKHNGVIGKHRYCRGIIEAAEKLLAYSKTQGQ